MDSDADDDADTVANEIGDVVVVDAGSDEWRAGFVTDEGPSVVVSGSSVSGGMAADRWRDIFEHLDAEPTEHSVLVTEPPGTPRDRREATVATLLAVGCKAAFVAAPQLLALFASDATTGVVVDVGEETTTIWPVYDCQPVLAAATSHALGGAHLTRFLMERMQ
eukprot:6761778-Prymnesium_polylepis.1